MQILTTTAVSAVTLVLLGHTMATKEAFNLQQGLSNLLYRICWAMPTLGLVYLVTGGLCLAGAMHKMAGSVRDMPEADQLLWRFTFSLTAGCGFLLASVLSFELRRIYMVRDNLLLIHVCTCTHIDPTCRCKCTYIYTHITGCNGHPPVLRSRGLPHRPRPQVHRRIRSPRRRPPRHRTELAVPIPLQVHRPLTARQTAAGGAGRPARHPPELGPYALR